jgi:hypothetical protein
MPAWQKVDDQADEKSSAVEWVSAGKKEGLIELIKLHIKSSLMTTGRYFI